MLKEKLMSCIGFFIFCFWGLSLNAKDTRTGYVNNNGVDIYWTDTGRGKEQTIFLIHGFPLSGE